MTYDDSKVSARPTILGIPFDPVTLDHAIQQTTQAIRDRRFFHVVTPGPEFLMAAQTNTAFRRILQRADLSLPDGIGIIFAARFLGKPRLHRITGMEYLSAVVQRASTEGWSVFLFGAMPGVAERAAQQLIRRYPTLRIAGIESGFRGWFRLPDRFICWKVRRSRADIVLVALGAPVQELWIERNRSALGNVRVAVGVGGAFDYWAGVVQYPPRFVRQLGLEWLWRLMLTPRTRFRRIIAAVWEFPLAIVREKLQHGS